MRYFCNCNISTAPQFQAVRYFHDVRARDAGRQRCATKLFLALLSSEPDVGVQFLKDVGLIRSSLVCGSAYRDLETHGYTHQTVNHTIGCLDVRTGARTNTIERTGRNVKAFLRIYNRNGDYINHLSHYMFAAVCQSNNVDSSPSSSAWLQP